ncbi:polyketide synthase [Moniliophthora roreri MCA 2997]|uniref:Polyketide synthase n=1 Tax=Moniliophthora roreri (strain MCA 2997) TaxID=1381753 RepID=V2XZ90_MONRO|nr:polyketide synthase [Moniliophthora roreri MCA 2997]
MTQPKPIEILFKQASGVDIYMDVYIPPSATKEKPAPIYFWWHGGGLLQGTRKGVAPHHLLAPTKYNIAVISADYRLAPQFRMPAILEDCADAITFLSTPKFAEATEGKLDPTKIVLSGSSAGGWLSLLCGLGVGFRECGLTPPPKPTGIVAIYPITDLEDSFWKTPQRPVSYLDRVLTNEDVDPFVSPDDEGSKCSGATLDGRRSMFYHWMVQEAQLANLLLDKTNIPPTAFSIAPFIRKLSADAIPPTYVVHGTIDDKVPISQAQDVVAALEAVLGKEKEGDIHGWIYEEVGGVNHGYDREEGVDMEKMWEFVKGVLGA